MLTKEKITEWFKSLQDTICETLEKEDGKGRFQEENWIREEGGGGRTRVLQKGNVIEKGGVNFSAVHGELPEQIVTEILQTQTINSSKTPNSGLPTSNFYATGVSIVIHPENPMVPIIHMNVRYFEMSNGSWWFGGGIDLTPHYIDEEDAAFFHNALKTTCNKHTGKQILRMTVKKYRM